MRSKRSNGVGPRTAEGCGHGCCGITQRNLRREQRQFVVLFDRLVSPSVMSPVESASGGFFELRFRWKTLAQRLAVIRSFVPVNVGDGKLLFPFGNFAFRPVPGRTDSFRF